MPSKKTQMVEFAENLFNSMNISEEQKIIFSSIFNQTVESMNENDFKKMEEQVVEYVEKSKESNVFD